MPDKFEVYTDIKEELRKDYVTKDQMIQAIHNNNEDFRTEARADRRWMIGLFITAIISIPALIKLLSYL